MWTSPHRTPPYYPDAVTLDDRVAPQRILAHVDTSTPGCSIKDSFARLNLASSGFVVLINAEWIYRPADAALAANGTGARWDRVHDADLLSRWEAAWAEDGSATGLFRPPLLEHEEVMVLAAHEGHRVVAGAILNRSEAVVGVSNLFTTRGTHRDAWADCLAAVAEYIPGVPVVGYEECEALTAAHDLGFASIGPLRIWVATGV
jgi:hypothetical protein